jgi:N-acetylmuramoyl-L-alanine amidase
MKFGIDIGHNCPPHDTGASGIKQEDLLTKEVGNKVITKLTALGHTVINCTPSSATSVSNSLQQRVNKANSNKVDIFVSIHFNAFNKTAHGTEVFAVSPTGNNIALEVLNKIVKLGFSNRGVKSGSSLFVVKNTTMPAILVECCFCDSSKDMTLFSTVTADKMAQAIVDGLV